MPLCRHQPMASDELCSVAGAHQQARRRSQLKLCRRRTTFLLPRQAAPRRRVALCCWRFERTCRASVVLLRHQSARYLPEMFRHVQAESYRRLPAFRFLHRLAQRPTKARYRCRSESYRALRAFLCRHRPIRYLREALRRSLSESGRLRPTFRRQHQPRRQRVALRHSLSESCRRLSAFLSRRQLARYLRVALGRLRSRRRRDRVVAPARRGSPA